MNSVNYFNLECYTEGDERLTIPVKVELRNDGISIAVPNYEFDLSVIVEYYDGELQVLVWGEENIGRDCVKHVLSHNFPETLKKIEEHYEGYEK